MSRTAGHYAPWFLAALVSGLIVLTLVPEWAGVVPWPLLAGVLLAVLVAALYLALCVFAHNRRLCERCVGSVPLDASRVASRYGLRFRVAHLFERKALAVAYLATVLGAAVLSTHPVGRYVWAAAQASLIYLLFVYVTHQRLQPWCPQCRQGGSHQITPTRPNPVSSGV
jgi:hypothetical protein